MEKLGAVSANRLKNTALLWQSKYKLLWYFGSFSRNIWYANMRPDAVADEDFKKISSSWRKNYTSGFSHWSSDNEYELPSDSGDKKIEVLSAQMPKQCSEAEWIYLRIPADGVEADLKTQFAQLLRTHPMRLVADTTRRTGVSYPFSSFKGMDLDVLQMAADVWLARETDAVELKLGTGKNTRIKKKTPLHIIGNDLRVSPSQLVLPGDSAEGRELKNAAMKVAVSRMLGRAEKLIANVEQGVFPSYAPVVNKTRWQAGMEPDFNSPELLVQWYEQIQRIELEVEHMNALCRGLQKPE